MSGLYFGDFVKVGKKILGTTTNYRSSLKVLNVKAPEKPIIFSKPTTSYITEGQCIKIPNKFTVNHEIELGVIIREQCYRVKEHQAKHVIAGYCVALDMTATCQINEARSKGLPWIFAKGFDTACPVSRFISRNEIPNPNDLNIFSTVNGHEKQNGNTSEFIFPIPSLIAYITQYITLEPNDLILTGTPPGACQVVPGDVITGGIKGLLTIKFHVT